MTDLSSWGHLSGHPPHSYHKWQENKDSKSDFEPVLLFTSEFKHETYPDFTNI